MTAIEKILIIDDEEMVRSAIALVLARAGYNTKTANGVKQGLELCTHNQFDLIFTDLVMPGMDGVDFIQELRKQENNTPVIALTGGLRIGQKNLSALALEAGAILSLRKPVDKKQLLHAIASVNGQTG